MDLPRVRCRLPPIYWNACWSSQQSKFVEEVSKPSRHLEEVRWTCQVEVQVATNLLSDPAWSVAKQNPYLLLNSSLCSKLAAPISSASQVGWTCQ